jgi:hypothetical protein
VFEICAELPGTVSARPGYVIHHFGTAFRGGGTNIRVIADDADAGDVDIAIHPVRGAGGNVLGVALAHSYAQFVQEVRRDDRYKLPSASIHMIVELHANVGNIKAAHIVGLMIGGPVIAKVPGVLLVQLIRDLGYDGAVHFAKRRIAGLAGWKTEGLLIGRSNGDGRRQGVGIVLVLRNGYELRRPKCRRASIQSPQGRRPANSIAASSQVREKQCSDADQRYQKDAVFQGKAKKARLIGQRHPSCRCGDCNRLEADHLTHHAAD